MDDEGRLTPLLIKEPDRQELSNLPNLQQCLHHKDRRHWFSFAQSVRQHLVHCVGKSIVEKVMRKGGSYMLIHAPLCIKSLLVAWLSTSKIITIEVPLSRTTYYVQCSYQGSASSVFTTILTVVAGIQLLFATFLAIKTRTVGKRYSKYSEYRQIGISV